MSQKRARAARQAANQPVGKAAGRSSKVGKPGSGRNVRLLAAVTVAIVAAVVGGVLIARGRGAASAVAISSRSSISFSGADPITGNTVSTTAYAGKPLVVNVWGSWCPGCLEEAAALQTFVERHPEIQMIGIDLNDTKRGAQAFYRQTGWKHPSVYDPSGKIAYRLGLQGTPTTFFLDRDHRIVARIVGATDLAGFEQGLSQALSAS